MATVQFASLTQEAMLKKHMLANGYACGIPSEEDLAGLSRLQEVVHESIDASAEIKKGGVSAGAERPASNDIKCHDSRGLLRHACGRYAL